MGRGETETFSPTMGKAHKGPATPRLDKGHKIPLLETPYQSKGPGKLVINKEQNAILSKEVSNMLEMGVIQKVNHIKGEIISNVFMKKKKEKCQYRLIVNLKPLKSFIPHEKFKMETLKNVRDFLQPGDLMIKTDLKHAYYLVNMASESRKLLRFTWNGTLYEYTSVVFGLGPAPGMFTKLLKVPITVLRKMNISIVIYINDMLIIADSQQEMEQARDPPLFLLQHIGFVINWEKSFLEPTKQIDFLGVQIDSTNMTFSIPEPKLNKIISFCQSTLQNPYISLKNLAVGN